MHEYQTGHSWDALTQNQNRRATRGDGVLDGGAVTAGDSTSGVQSVVAAGTVVLDDQICTLEPNALPHDDGASLPRRDVVIAKRTGDNQAAAEVITGDPGEWSTLDGTEYRYAEGWSPQPPDTAGTNGTVLGVVTVDAGATQSSGILDVEDRRREPAPTPRVPWRTPNIGMSTVGLDKDDFYAEPLGAVPGGSVVKIWSLMQMRFDGGQRVAWDTTNRNWRLGLMAANDDPATATYVSTNNEAEIGEPWQEYEIGGTSGEIKRLWLRMYNFSQDMGAEERWGARLAITIDSHPGAEL